jgi:hypothetical protein
MNPNGTTSVLSSQMKSFLAGIMAYWEAVSSFLKDQPISSLSYLAGVCQQDAAERNTTKSMDRDFYSSIYLSSPGRHPGTATFNHQESVSIGVCIRNPEPSTRRSSAAGSGVRA